MEHLIDVLVFVSKTNGTPQNREQEDQNKVKEQELLQVKDNLLEHRDNWRETLKDSHKLKSSEDGQHDDTDHNNLRHDVKGIVD
jgi:hypothetical protein